MHYKKNIKGEKDAKKIIRDSEIFARVITNPLRKKIK